MLHNMGDIIYRTALSRMCIASMHTTSVLLGFGADMSQFAGCLPLWPVSLSPHTCVRNHKIPAKVAACYTLKA